jgi:hypothetical protein
MHRHFEKREAPLRKKNCHFGTEFDAIPSPNGIFTFDLDVIPCGLKKIRGNGPAHHRRYILSAEKIKHSVYILHMRVYLDTPSHDHTSDREMAVLYVSVGVISLALSYHVIDRDRCFQIEIIQNKKKYT